MVVQLLARAGAKCLQAGAQALADGSDCSAEKAVCHKCYHLESQQAKLLMTGSLVCVEMLMSFFALKFAQLLHAQAAASASRTATFEHMGDGQKESLESIPT